MDMQGAVRARLLAASPVTALVGQRVYWSERPQGSALPAIILRLISQVRRQHMQGFDGLIDTRVQVSIYAERSTDIPPITEAAVAALIPAHNGNGIEFQRAFFEGSNELNERTETAFIYGLGIDLMMHHTAA